MHRQAKLLSFLIDKFVLLSSPTPRSQLRQQVQLNSIAQHQQSHLSVQPTHLYAATRQSAAVGQLFIVVGQRQWSKSPSANGLSQRWRPSTVCWLHGGHVSCIVVASVTDPFDQSARPDDDDPTRGRRRPNATNRHQSKANIGATAARTPAIRLPL